jgi:hypothetical protein
MLAKSSPARDVVQKVTSECQTGENADVKPIKPIIAMTLKLPRDVYMRLKSTALARGVTAQSLMSEAVRQYLKATR